MQSSKRILVVVDPQSGPEQHAVVRGAWLARKLGVGLDLLASCYRQYPTAQAFYAGDLLGKGREAEGQHLSEHLEHIARNLGPDFTDSLLTTIVDLRLSDAIIRHAQATKPLLVVKETHHHDLAKRTLLTNTDWELVRHCPAPVWLVKSTAWQDNASVLASVDPTSAEDPDYQVDSAIMDFAKHLASSLNAPLHVFHSFIPIPVYAGVMPDTGAWIPAGVEEAQEAAHKNEVNDLLKGRQIAPENIHIEPGPATRLLPECALKVKAGVVVMGSIARSRLKRVFVGSTVETVLEHINSDVLVIKPPKFSGPVDQKLSGKHSKSDKTMPSQTTAIPDHH